MRKFRIDPAIDDLDSLLDQTWLRPNREIVEMLLGLGERATCQGETSTVASYMSTLGWALDNDSPLWRDHRSIVDVLCIFAEKGFRWENRGKNELHYFRQGLARCRRHEALQTLKRLTTSGFMTTEVFQRLSGTPKMKEILDPGPLGGSKLWKLAGLASPKERLRAKNRRGVT